MKFLSGATLIVRNTVLVTLTIALGFAVSALLGLPSWTMPLCLLPGAWLFCALTGEKRPFWWQLTGFFALFSVLELCFSLFLPQAPAYYYHRAIQVVIISFCAMRQKPEALREATSFETNGQKLGRV